MAEFEYFPFYLISPLGGTSITLQSTYTIQAMINFCCTLKYIRVTLPYKYSLLKKPEHDGQEWDVLKDFHYMREHCNEYVFKKRYFIYFWYEIVNET